MRSFPHSWPVCNVTRVTQQVLLVGAGTVYPFALPKFTTCLLWDNGIHVAQSLIFCDQYTVFAKQCLSFCPYSYDICIMSPSIYSFYLPLSNVSYIVRRKMSTIMSRIRRMGIISFSPYNHIHFFLGRDHANHHPHPLKMVTRHRYRFHQIFQDWAINKVIILEISVTPMHLGIFLCYNKVGEATKFGDRIFF